MLRALAGPLALTLLTLGAPTVSLAAHSPFAARAGLEVATAAAQSWAQDAVLVYLENDEDLDAQGAAVRWGYLFYSTTAQKARAYSVRDGRILAAENLDIKFEAPPVASGWIDSGAAIDAAEREVGRVFKQQSGGRLSTMLLMRGAFDDVNPDRTTWMLIYTVPNAPSLFVVVDAAEGKVRRTWRG
jgi:hypothetical protein